MKKKCPKCGIIKNKELDFYNSNGKKKITHGLCKSCILEYNIEQRRVVKEEAVKYLGGKCAICGYNKSIASLDFHHVNPNEKDTSFYNLKAKFSDKFKKELDKCILLCANCHRELHYNEKTLGKH